jgi:ATP-binding cassette subfamily B protein
MRVQITELLFERMVGHRTRIVQQSPEHWHEDEDSSLARYLALSAKLDASYVFQTMAGQRGWLLVGLGGLLPTLLFEAPSAASIAVSLGGVILANQAFGGLAGSLWSLIAALVAWTGVAPLFRAAANTGEVGRPLRFDIEGARKQAHISRPRGALLDVRELTARHPRRSRPVLAACGLQVLEGERILLSGASGAGKSTLAMVLLGLRGVDAGLLLFKGLDQRTLGAAGWRRQIALTPQFQDNFVFTGTLAFNLLMGREWPAGPETLREAEAVCRELGLGELIDKMPLGLMTMVGRSGWQLSHGERSRVYIARSLLQRAPLTILDDSFATLDPENVVRALDTVLARAPTLIVMVQR